MTRKCARWWLRSARKRSLQDRSPTVATEIFENSFFARVTRSFVAEIWTRMIAALETSATDFRADMLSLDTVVDESCSNAKWFELALCSLTLNGLAFSGAASLTTLMSTTVERCFTGPRAVWWLFRALMTDSIEAIAAASARDGHRK